MRVLAVDFGTSNTVAALAVDGGAPRLVTVDGSPLVPSSVFLTDDGTLAVGRDADRQARIDPSRYEPNPKRRIDEGEILLGRSTQTVVRVIAAVLARVSGEVRRQLHDAPDELRLTHPARWGQHRREVLIAAAKESGLVKPGTEPILIPEPVAAATHFATLSGGGLATEAPLAVYDLGAGTFDVAVVRRAGERYDVLAEAGLPDLGGLDFDHAILDHIGISHALGVRPDEWDKLLHPTDSVSRRLARALMTDVRDAKEALSRYPHTDIALPPPFTDLHLTRIEFEQLIRPALGRSIDLMRTTIDGAGFTASKLAGVYLVGGSSRVPLVARLIQEGLGVTPTTLDQPETSVATGALYLQTGRAERAARGPLSPPTGTQSQIRPASGARTAGPPGRSGPGGAATHSTPPPRRSTAPATNRPDGPRPMSPSQWSTSGGPASGYIPVQDDPSTRASTGSQRPAGATSGPQRAARSERAGLQAPSGSPVAQRSTTTRQRLAPDRTETIEPQTSGGDRKPWIYGAGGVAAVIALVVILIVTLGGGNGGSGGTGPGATSSSPPGDSSTKELAKAFNTSITLKNYVSPTFGEIKSCTAGAGALSQLGANLTAVTCTYKNGFQAFYVEDNGGDVDRTFSSFESGLNKGDQSKEKDYKSGSHSGKYVIITNPDGMLWTAKDKNIIGYVQPTKTTDSGVFEWWKARFGR